MHIKKLYYKWDRTLEQGKFKLNEYVSIKEKAAQFITEENSDWYQIKNDKNVKVKFDAEGRIDAKFFVKESQVGNLKVRFAFIGEIKNELDNYLEICEKEYSGDKLILHFGDALLHVVLLLRGNENNHNSLSTKKSNQIPSVAPSLSSIESDILHKK